MTSSVPVPQKSPAVNLNSVSISVSPQTKMAQLSLSQSPNQSTIHERFRKESTGLHIRQPRVLRPTDKDEIKLLLLENISMDAVASFREQGFQVDHFTKAWTEDELVEKIGQYHGIGIRSKTKITQRVLKAASKLVVIGCFCIGTNQVDLSSAARAGIPVFNSPFSNSRSVAELVMSELVVLSRQLFDRAREMKDGVWNKTSKNCWEVRGKTLGIIGYGHIGSQLSVLAESFGIRVLFYDVINIMPLGSARQMPTLQSLLAESDYVTLHVPELPETINLIGEEQLAQMKRGSYLINNARGKVVDIPALVASLKSGHLAGAAVDVFPAEPGANGSPFDDKLNSWSSELRSCPNVILTPHIGGSTEEAQRMIGEEVSTALTRYLNLGTSFGSVNFPEVDLRAIDVDQPNQIRLCHVHVNQPGVLRQVNEILSPYNVEKQYSDSKGDIAYLMADISDVSKRDIERLQELISKTSANILTRMLA
ncbi:d-3-phosphoglycerate dehydrogenase [Pyrrhoderma noxium]|uniref:D-3-phosphoglycerate dehydrogenase n=1 Tax=Pyrrhoderma noxium TaxID=2282107 RepID=A0A286UQT7_9AGAM|nr:d-3-phosphoglycerate dehydrogenase [Pyrrhoderma noxium]